MNREQAKGVVKHFEVVKAFAEGKTIEYRWADKNPASRWIEAGDGINFLSEFEYRVKPVSRTVYVNLYGRPDETGVFPGSDENFWTEYPTAEEARKGAMGGVFAAAVPVTIED